MLIAECSRGEFRKAAKINCRSYERISIFSTQSRLLLLLLLLGNNNNNNKRICIAQVCRMTSEALGDSYSRVIRLELGLKV